MMKCEKIFEMIDFLYESYISVWEDVCNIESPTKNKEGVDAVGNYFIELAKKRGWNIEIAEQEKAGNAVCITMNPDADASPISFSGHMDTVHAVGSFGTPAVRIDSEKIYGPGVCDCKGGIVAGFLAMDALDRCGIKARPVQLLLQSDEEVGSRLSKRRTINYICEKAKDSVAFLNLEESTAGKACVAIKGIATFRFDVSGIEAHSSKCATEGANAITEAAHKIIELEKIKDEGGLTCNCGLISGGTVVNTVPGKCTFYANVRFVTSEQLEWMQEHARKVAETIHVEGCSCTVEQTGLRVAMPLVDRNIALLEKMNGIFTENGLSVLEGTLRTGGSDAADVTVYGIPCIDSLGVAGGRIHSGGEFAYLSSLAESAKRLAAVAYCI